MSDHLGRRLSALIDGELGDSDRERVLAHLARCEPCRAEAIALRAIKQRMRALGEATACDALTRRLIELAALYGNPPPQARAATAGRTRRHRARVMVAAGVAVMGLAIPTAAFVAGGGRQSQGPRITPSVDVFMVQHAITTGEVPVQPTAAAPSSPGVASQTP